MRKMAYNPPTVQMPVERTWALVEGDAVAVMPDWAIGGTEASKDALSSTRHRAWLAARRRASGTTLHPHATTITHCQHSLTNFTNVVHNLVLIFCVLNTFIPVYSTPNYLLNVFQPFVDSGTHNASAQSRNVWSSY